MSLTERLEVLRDNWGHTPKVLNQVNESVWNWADVERLIYRIAKTISAPWLRLLVNGQYLAYESLLSGEAKSLRDMTRSVDPEKLMRFINKGALLVIRSADSYVPDLFAINQELSVRFRCPVTCNLYIGTSRANGFRPHFDTHHILALQLFGTKTWSLLGQEAILPTKLSTCAGHLPRTEQVRKEKTASGDVLYLPRGYWHSANPGDSGTVHASFGIHIPTGAELLAEVAAALSNDPKFAADRYSFEGVVERPEPFGILLSHIKKAIA